MTCPGLSYLVWGDATHYLQAVLNLASNAVKYTPSGFVRICINPSGAGASPAAGRVGDGGPGVAPQCRRHLFERFGRGGAVGRFRARSRIEHSQTPGGIDGWRGRVAEQCGHGEHLLVPRLVRDARSAVARQAPGGCRSGQALELKHSGARILLVEDEPINRKSPLPCWRDVGLVVDLSSATASRALPGQARSDYRLIFMDMQIPHMDGLTATREIRRLPDWSDAPSWP